MDPGSRARLRWAFVRSSSRLIATLALIVATTVPAAAQLPYFENRDLQAVVNSLDVIDTSGKRWTAADLRGRVVLIDFWATWCAPCLQQIPAFKRLRANYRERFEVLAVSLDSHTRRDFITWVNRHGLTWPQVHDGRAFSSPVARSFGVRALPASLLVVDGAIVARNLRGAALDRAVAHLTSTSTLDAARMPIVIR